MFEARNFTLPNDDIRENWSVAVPTFNNYTLYDLAEWCKNNTQKQWTFCMIIDDNDVWYFESGEDHLAFKLRWC